MNNKRIVKNIGISMVMKPISMVLSLLYTPLALAFLGDEKYGVWGIILNIVSWINYFDIGIGNGLRNKLTEAIAIDDKEAAKRYVSTAYFGTTIISACFCFIITLVWNLLHLSEFFKLTTSDENTNLVVFISVLFVCINFILALSRTSAYSIQQPGIINVVGAVGQLLQIIIILVISRFFQQSLLSIALMYGIVSLFDNLLIYFFVSHNRDYLKPSLSAVSIMHMKPLLTLGLGFFILQICSLILNTTDNLLISRLYGSTSVTPYSIVYKVFYICVQVHAIIIMPMWSAYTEASAKKDITWIKKTMNKINMITLILSMGVIIGIFMFKPIAKIWLGRELNYSTGLIITVAIYMIAQMFGNNYSSFLCGIGHIKVSTILSAIGAVLNIPLSVLFARTMGLKLTGIILGSLAVMSIGVVVLPIVSYRWIANKQQEWGNG